MKNIFAVTVLLFVLSGCETQKETVEYKSENGEITITISGSRSSSFDPWSVELNIKGWTHDETLVMDMYNSDFDKNTVLAEWKDANSCIVTLKQSDGADRVMDVFVSSEKISLRERGK